MDCTRRQGYSMPAKHMHREYEVYVLLEGAQFYFVEEKHFSIRAGDIMLIGKEKIHWTGIAACPVQKRVVLSIEEEWLDPFLETCGIWKLAQLFDGCRLLRPEKEDFLEICGLLETVRMELAGHRLGYENMVKMKLAELFLLLLRSRVGAGVSRAREAATLKVELAGKAIDYIQAHCREKLEIQEIADALYISRAYLTRIFKEVTGVTVCEYINIQRVQIGKKLLLAGPLSVTAIADSAGFASATYFEKVFRRYTAKTPREYRARLLEHV